VTTLDLRVGVDHKPHDPRAAYVQARRVVELVFADLLFGRHYCETFNQTATYIVDPADQRGTYTLSVTASSKTGTATATAQVTYV
jgi:hypothetical protein